MSKPVRRGGRYLAEPADSVAKDSCDEPSTGKPIASKQDVPSEASREPTMLVEPLRACRAAGGARYLLTRLAGAAASFLLKP